MRKNILILVHSYGLPFIESCNQYTRLFNSDEYDVTVAYLVGVRDEHIIQKTLAKNIIFLECAKRSVRGLKLAAIYKVLKLCREKNFDIVICHRYKPSYIMLWVNHLCRIPNVICVTHAMGAMQSFWRRLLIAALSKKNMIFAGVSNAVRNDLRRVFFGIAQERIVTLPNIIDYELFEPKLLPREEARAILKLPAHAFVFGHVGRLAKEKDQKTLIQAFAQVVTQHPHAKLILIGDGPLETELKKLANHLGIENHVLFAGFIPDGFRFMKAFDAFILCSIKESFGRVLLEAMIACTPIIATKTNGIPEVVGDAGFLVEAANSKDLAAKMLTASQLPTDQLVAIGKQGRQRMLDHFSLTPFRKIFWQLPLKGGSL